MKKLFIIGMGLTLSSLAFQSAAQSSNDKVRFGIKAGANLMKLGNIEFLDQEFKTDYKVGFQAGIYADLPFADNFSFLPEATYTQKGGKITETVGDNTGSIDTKISYIDVPLLIGYRATPELTVFAGPQISFLLAQETTTKVNNDASTSNSDT